MYLEKLEIQGFKSFANKNILIFPGLIDNDRRGLTAVVGPNGSGKSNVADSIRWALGEQSMKTLRGKKSEDVIFSGSDKKGKLGMAEVSLYFNNEDRLAPIDFSHFVLTRRLYRDGESEYLINNSRVRLLDVQLMLAKANVGQKTYSVIGQGTVEGFLNTSLSERKEFFDEATGVKQFQIKRDEALNKLRLSLEHLGQAEMLLAEIEPRLSNLTRQVNRLHRRGEIEAELRVLQLAYFRTVWHEINDKFKVANDALLEAEKDKQIKDKKLTTLNTELLSLQKQAGASQEFDRLQNELSSLQSKREKLQMELIKIEARRELKMETEQAYFTKETAIELQKRLKRSLELLEKAEKLNDTDLIKKAFVEIKRELSELHDLALANTKNQIKEKNSVDDSLKSNLDKEINSLDSEIKSIKEKLSRFTDAQEAERQKLFTIQNSLQTLQRELNELSNKLNESRVEAARQETKLEDLENAIRQDLGGLKEVRDERHNEAIDRFAILDKINQLKRQMELIGGIDPEIETEYISTKERHDFLANQVTDLLNTGQSLEKIIEELDETIKGRFDKEFKIISEKFEEYFKILFNGGNAKIIKVMAEDLNNNDESSVQTKEEDEALTMSASAIKLKRIKYLQKYNATGLAGIEIQATPPGKKIKSIAMLSGGERALTAIALICAIISANPSPFVVLDEVDAALDEANSERLAKILDDLSHKTQFIVITHNRASMMRAAVLYGITMQEDGVSKLLSLKLEDAKYNR